MSMHRTLWAVLVCTLVSGSAWAEEVFVKYRGPVNLDGFRCAATDSSFVHRICYLPAKQYVVVLLGNTYYHYCRVPGSVVSDWLSAESKGRFYNAEVKGRFVRQRHGLIRAYDVSDRVARSSQ